MESMGLPIGVFLIAAVTVLAFALGARAARSVESFREEHHESFSGRRPGGEG